jgi:uncharacterized protein (TIGR03435 family)
MMTPRPIVLFAYVILAISALAAQTFEVVSVKKSAGGETSGVELPSPQDTAHINYRGVTLNSVLALAYGVRPDQITGPKWLGEERFDIAATLPAGATPAQVPVMLQHLLTERLGMTVHEQTKPTTFYALVPAKGGVKMKAVEKPEIRATVDMSSENIELKDYTMVNFAKFLTTAMGRPVVDETGLTASFDIRLFVSLADLKSAKAVGAIHELGLNLEKRNAPVKSLIVDKADKVPAGD